MKLFMFSSANLTNIWAGIGSRLWAVSRGQSDNAGIATKASRLPVGAFGLFYCVQTQSLTTPFVIRSVPQNGVIARDVWPEADGWHLPFSIMPIGSPRRQIPKGDLASVLPSLAGGAKQWDHLLHIQPLTVFAPSEISDEDWQALVVRLADA